MMWLRMDTGFEIQTLEIRGRARYFSVMEAPHNTEFYEWMGKKHFCFFPTVKGSGTNHYHRAPALMQVKGATLF